MLLSITKKADRSLLVALDARLGIGVAHDGSLPKNASLADGLAKALDRSVIERASAVAASFRTDEAAVSARMLIDGADCAGAEPPVQSTM